MLSKKRQPSASLTWNDLREESRIRPFTSNRKPPQDANTSQDALGRSSLFDHAVRDPGNSAGLIDRNPGHAHALQRFVPQGRIQSLKFRYIAAPGKPDHDLHRAFVVHPRLFIFDINAEFFFGRYFALFVFLVFFVAVKVIKIVRTDKRPNVRCIDQIVGKISLKTAVSILPRMLADRRLDGILMNISDDSEQLVSVANRPALEAGLEKTANTFIFLVVPVHEAGNDMLKDPAKGHLAGLDDQMNVVRHQTISEDLVTANGLIFTKNRQKLAVIIVIGKDLLLVDTAINNVMNVEGAFFALRC